MSDSTFKPGYFDDEVVTIQSPVTGQTVTFGVSEFGYLNGGELDSDCQMCGGGFPALVQWLIENGLAVSVPVDEYKS